MFQITHMLETQLYTNIVSINLTEANIRADSFKTVEPILIKRVCEPTLQNQDPYKKFVSCDSPV